MIRSHEPVLLKEVIEELHIKKFDKIIDATLGAGGYTSAILAKDGEVLGIDADESMLQIARDSILKGQALLIGDYTSRMTYIHGNFRDIGKIARNSGFEEVAGIVFDLGVSNVHFSDMQRGFSFKNPDADLDMRLDPESNSVKASDLLNVLREDQLTEILGKNIAKRVVEFRKTKKFETVGDFNSLFTSFSGKAHGIDPRTVPYMNLRIGVNSELDNLREALPAAWNLLREGGRLVVVSFHSGEDEIVKDFVKSKGGANDFVRPSAEEVARNPKSRSAILRVITKTI